MSIKSIITKLFPKTTAALRSEGYLNCQDSQVKSRIADQNADLEFKKSLLLGQWVISVGNDGSINIGKVKGFLDKTISPIPVITDIITQEELVCFGITRLYSEELLEIILDIGPVAFYELSIPEEYLWNGKRHEKFQKSYNDYDPDNPALSDETVAVVKDIISKSL